MSRFLWFTVYICICQTGNRNTSQVSKWVVTFWDGARIAEPHNGARWRLLLFEKQARSLNCRLNMVSERPNCRVLQGSHASLKVLETTWIFSSKFKALKVLENRTGPWKSLNFIPQVLEGPWIHQVKLCNISSSVKQVFCLKNKIC